MDEFSLHMLGLGPRGPRRQQNTCSGDQVRDLDQRHAGWGGGPCCITNVLPRRVMSRSTSSADSDSWTLEQGPEIEDF